MDEINKQGVQVEARGVLKCSATRVKVFVQVSGHACVSGRVQVLYFVASESQFVLMANCLSN